MEMTATQSLDLGADQLQPDVKLQRLRVPALDDANSPGEPLRLVDRAIELEQPLSARKTRPH